MRFTVAILLAFAGCVYSVPDDPTLTADLACETARALIAARVPVPDDNPKPGDRCSNCDGRGYVGDGRIKISCEACRGTGRITERVVRQPAVVIPCPTGKCRP